MVERVRQQQQRTLRVVATVDGQVGRRSLEVRLEQRVDHAGVAKLRKSRPLQSRLGIFDLRVLVRLAARPQGVDSHARGGEGACLVRADGGGAAHGLARAQVTHQVLVLEHLLDREGKRDGDREGQPLRHRNHKDGDASNDKPKDLRPVHAVVPLLEAALVAVEGEPHADQQDDDEGDRDPHGHGGDQVGHSIKLPLEDRASRVRLLHLLGHGPLVRVGADGQHEQAALALLHEGAGEHCGRRHNLLVLDDVGARLLLHHSLAREHLLVDGQVVAAHHHPVGGEHVARAEQHNVAHDEL
mmetsp:Transcript_17024/g.33447  ORF Transcript_17024/g.33447 Transcript_17024/m.33447 type:complete len:299 (+) Transcript_17024:1996-2892(+)